ncbi:hypothetical protein PENSPDRAFT_758432 [Peniophora sp. CONT]|nr:hypothetical protein PENSPDRAFT_758432 [Peniophora sp. CONT]
MSSNASLAELVPDFNGYVKGVQVLASRPTDPLVLGIVESILPQLPNLLEPMALSSLVQDYLTCVTEASPDDPEGRVRAIQKLNDEHKELVSVIGTLAKLQDLSEHRLCYEYPPGAAPIYKLPVELLSYVFSFLANGRPRIHPRKPVLVNVSTIVTLSCVCRLWHQVVQEHTPELWSTISTTYASKRLDRALHASKGALLDLHIGFGPKTETTSAYFEVGNEREQALMRALAEMSHARTLDINLMNDVSQARWGTSEYDKESDLRTAAPAIVFERLAQVDAPALESLKLCMSHHRLLPELFRDRDLPHLKKIDLYGCEGPMPSLFLRAKLTSLTLRSCDTLWASMDELLSFFSASPTLETIRLDADHGGLPFSRNLQPLHHPAHSVAMPSLGYLQLTMELECIAPLLRALNLPPVTNIEISGGYLNIAPNVYDDAFTDLVDELKNNFEHHLHLSYPSPITSPLVANGLRDGFRRVTIRDFGEQWQDEGVTVLAELPSSIENGPSSFEFGACHLPETVKEHLEIIRTILSLPGIEGAFNRLIVNKRQLLQVSWHWRAIFEYLEQVEVLDLSGPPGRAFLRAYGASSDHSPDDTVLPNLQKVIIRNGKVGSDVIEEAMGYLHWRAERGPVEPISFSFFNCSIAEDSVRMMREHDHVSQVVWDGRIDGWEGEKGRPWWNIGFGGEESEPYDSDGTVSGYGTEPDEWW